MDWYAAEEDDVLEELESSEEGLSQEEAESRLDKHGPNSIRSDDQVHPVKILISQFQDFLIYLLIVAAFTSFFLGETIDAALIFLILFANGIFGFIQDYKAEKSIEALKDMSTPNTTVLRDGEKRTIDSDDVVPGDIVFIEQGDAVPADARLIEAQSLSTDESALTGESNNVSKSPGVLESASLAERTNMVYKNTTAVKGRGKAIVVATGMDTRVGDIAEQINQAEDRKTPFQEEVDELGKKIGYGIMAIIALVAVVQLFFTGNGFTTSFTELVPVLMVAITLAVAAVPEGLPAVVTLTLALGSRKMLEKNALVRSLPVVESLGSVNEIVTDKTGTLTEDLMTVKRLHYQGEDIQVTGTGTSLDGGFEKDGHEVDTEYLKPLLETGVICNNAEKAPESEDTDYYGEPTEVALLVSGLKSGLENSGEREREIPFSSDRKRMTVVKDGTAHMKGAPETVLERCDRVLVDDEVKELTDEHRERLKQKNQEFAEDALRVLGFAKKEVDGNEDEKELEEGMIFLGLQGMIDPPREEVKDAVEDCRNAGIRVVMATGDNIATAKAIGKEIGFNPEDAMTGQEIEQLDEEELQDTVEDVEIFARVSPHHKVMILQALQANGNNVAMTGDGVNDAPALKNADVGVSMGQRGTDVAQQASDMVLQDDNFVTIRDAIAEGRGIFDNIRKFVNYLLSANAGEVLAVFFGILIGTMFFPENFHSTTEEALILTPVMLLWLNMVTDGLPALALGADPKSEGIMDRPPRGEDEPVINRRMMASILGIGLLITVAGLPLFFGNLNAGLVRAQTMLFTFLVIIELVRIQIIRRRYHQSLLSNKWLIGALVSSVLLQLAVIYTPLNKVFQVTMLASHEWVELGVATAGFLVLAAGMTHLYDDIFTG